MRVSITYEMDVAVKKMSWPRGLNLDILFTRLNEKECSALIKTYSDESRGRRRIVLPSRRCIKKVFIHYLVEKHDGDFDQVMEELKGGKDKFLKDLGIRRDKVRQLYEQRKREIQRECQ